ncbi:MAG: Holliday junction branch migration protein RuvA [Deltaproteobacteria bacterium]|nr:Holliday junction branch migration protein RuvA [Deltaproteobacteria bacterium]MBW2016523.1 Holliday junction branch migration protein RuvA [Deltaproteobacteria bacterium]MBW2128280.1 Holliday junction branch migration protein RuvA [Deltaproteobacteria bacterium]MBW2302275.1 Holliday junction branch migration protein RuvA [Deltaproteobacteria bacterium]
MIARLKGILAEKDTQAVIIDNGGIGYQVLVPLSTFYTLPEVNQPVSLYIHTHVREDALLLFGFQTPLEKEIFLMLISVSGIGPKLAINILSGIGPEDLLQAMARGDSLRIRAIPGIGKKTAERIALELKDKALRMAGDQPAAAAGVSVQADKHVLDDALSALLNLGYPAKSASRAIDVARAGLKEITLEGLIKAALKILA